MKKKKNKIGSPEWVAIKTFAFAIMIGTLLLAMPFSNNQGIWTNPLTAFFTSTSSTCVTGLVVVDTGTYYNIFGQIVILCLIQLGGLGIMTMGTFFLVVAGRRLSMKDEFVLIDSLGNKEVRGLRSLIKRSVFFTFLLEAIGATVLACRFFTVYKYPIKDAIYSGIFHSVSAFCNAGFSLYKDSLTQFRSDPVIMFTIIILIVLGGLGFLVLHNLSSFKFWRRNRLTKGRLTIHSKIVLIATLILILTGFVAFFLMEYNNTLSKMPIKERLLVSLFQSVTPRTAGFNVVDIAKINPTTHFFNILFMFIGGAPGSTAGGMKVTTIIVLFLTVWGMMNGKEEIEIMRRTINVKVVREAITIFILSIFCVSFFFGIMLITEHVPIVNKSLDGPDTLLFEVVSAYATVGLSSGITAHLTAIGKFCLAICMFIGRLGPLTLALIIGSRNVSQAVRYPEEEIVVG